MGRYVIPSEFNISYKWFLFWDWRQLLYIGSGAVLAALSYALLQGVRLQLGPLPLGGYVALVMLASGVACAHFQPWDRGLFDWATIAFSFLRKPRVYVWSPRAQPEAVATRGVAITSPQRWYGGDR